MPQRRQTVRAWPVISERVTLDTRIFKLETHISRSPRTEREGEFIIIDAPDWVNVVALTDKNEVVMIEQYRHGTRETTLEIPGGMVDPDDPDPCFAAARELREETGYRAKTVEYLGKIAPNPAIQKNHCHTCLASGLHFEGEPQLDDNEDIATHLIPLSDVPSLIRDGKITHSLVVVAFVWFMGVGVPPLAIKH
jgi:ADP-ribose pyrophosphatase